MKQSISLLVLPKRIFDIAAKHFESNLPNESAIFVFGTVLKKRNGSKIAVGVDPLTPRDEDYIRKSPVSCEVSYKFIAREFPKRLEQSELVLTWHCHPMNGLSGTDKHDGHELMMKVFPNQLTGYYNEGTFVFYQYNDGFEEVPYKVVDTQQYDRQIKFLSELSQLKLASSHVAVIGCGSLGYQITLLLAQKGIGKFTLIDPDYWDKTSLNRVWIPLSHVGINKAESLAEILSGRNIEARALSCKVEDVVAEKIDDADLLVVATDTISSRIIANRLAVDSNRAAVIAAAEIRDSDNVSVSMFGDCLVYIPEKTPCYRCNLAYAPIELIRETEDPVKWKRFAAKYGLPIESVSVPSIVDLNTFIASLASDEVTKVITQNRQVVHHQYADFTSRSLIQIRATRNPECPSCSKVQPAHLNQSDLITTEDALKASSLG
jgi:molybdopterin/thiamine biosynthesis adenylyltransferase/proteasome lid subunit RPN8/RPN11